MEKELTGYPSIDKPWLKYYSEEAIHVTFPKATVYECIYKNNRDHGNEIAMTYYGKKITYRKLFAEIDKAARAFTALGVKSGDNVAICMPAVPEALYTVLALNKNRRKCKHAESHFFRRTTSGTDHRDGSEDPGCAE